MKLSISIETARSAALGNRKVIRECKLPNLVEDISQKITLGVNLMNTKNMVLESKSLENKVLNGDLNQKI